MNIRQTFGPPRSKAVSSTAILAASMVVVMLLGQLYAFEDFAATLSALLPYNDFMFIKVTAAVIVLFELLALPYLLGMYLSAIMRFVSALAALGIAGFWLMTCFTNAHAQNSGLFSTAVEISGGLFAAAWATLLFGLISRVALSDSKFRHVNATS